MTIARNRKYRTRPFSYIHLIPPRIT